MGTSGHLFASSPSNTFYAEGRKDRHHSSFAEFGENYAEHRYVCVHQDDFGAANDEQTTSDLCGTSNVQQPRIPCYPPSKPRRTAYAPTSTRGIAVCTLVWTARAQDSPLPNHFTRRIESKTDAFLRPNRTFADVKALCSPFAGSPQLQAVFLDVPMAFLDVSGMDQRWSEYDFSMFRGGVFDVPCSS